MLQTPKQFSIQLCITGFYLRVGTAAISRLEVVTFKRFLQALWSGTEPHWS